MYARLKRLYAGNRQQGLVIASVLLVFLAAYFMPVGTDLRSRSRAVS